MESQHGQPHDPAPSPAAIAAAIQLLGDESPRVAIAARDCLREFGERARPQLLRAAESGEPAVRVRARELLRMLEVRGLLRRLLALDLDRASRKKPEALLTGAMLSAQLVRTFTIAAPALSRLLRAEARQLRKRMKGRSLPVCARILSQHLSGTLGLGAADSKVGDLDQVLLDRVLIHKKGVPEALSLLWLLVGRWAGLQVTGVGMPGHFLIRLHGRRAVLLDPFHGGRQVTKTDCIRFLRSRGHTEVLSLLSDLSDREVLAHYLRALRRAAVAKGRPEAQETLRDALFRLEAR